MTNQKSWIFYYFIVSTSPLLPGVTSLIQFLCYWNDSSRAATPLFVVYSLHLIVHQMSFVLLMLWSFEMSLRGFKRENSILKSNINVQCLCKYSLCTLRWLMLQLFVLLSKTSPGRSKAKAWDLHRRKQISEFINSGAFNF